jgi:competence protein ComEA
VQAPAGTIDTDAVARSSPPKTHEVEEPVEHNHFSGGVPSTPAHPAVSSPPGKHHRATGSVTPRESDPLEGDNCDVGVDLDDEPDHAVGPIIASAIHLSERPPGTSAGSTMFVHPDASAISPHSHPRAQLHSAPDPSTGRQGAIGGWVPERRQRPVGDFDHGLARPDAVFDWKTSPSPAYLSTEDIDTDDEWDELPTVSTDGPVHAPSAGLGRHARRAQLAGQHSPADQSRAGRGDSATPENFSSHLTSDEGVPGAVDENDNAWVTNPAATSPPTITSGNQPMRARRIGRHWGRFAELWVPESLREARVDPGRKGAIVLLLIAALAATVTAVGVWRDRPESRPVETSAMTGIAATAVGRNSENAESSATPVPAEAATSAASTPSTEMVVSVTGLVANPGLVTLPSAARVADAIAAAGGTIPNADFTGVNLAARLADGDSVVIGSSANAPGVASSVDSGAASGGSAGSTPGTSGGLVNLNNADEAALDTLPGVGPVMAQNILAWRETNGGFTNIEQLQEITGIGPSRYAQISPLVTVS